MKKLKVALVGATGMVGRNMLKVLEDRAFPVGEISLFASKRSAGTQIPFKNEHYTVEELTENSFDRGIDIALFSAGANTSRKYAPVAVSRGTVVVDNSSAWRMNDDVPLVIPEVNPHDLDRHRGIISNPNCSTIQMLVALKPIHDKYIIKRIVVSTYQAVSGSGKKAVDELVAQVTGFVNNAKTKCDVYPYPIAFNALPHIDVFLDNGYSKEEMKMVYETKKILDPAIQVSATTVRVPVLRSHSESVNVETQKPVDPYDVMQLLKNAPGVKVVDDIGALKYPMAIHAEGKHDVFVGRIRKDYTIPNGLNMWIVSDNLLKGAALNTVQIAETLLSRKLV